MANFRACWRWPADEWYILRLGWSLAWTDCTSLGIQRVRTLCNNPEEQGWILACYLSWAQFGLFGILWHLIDILISYNLIFRRVTVSFHKKGVYSVVSCPFCRENGFLKGKLVSCVCATPPWCLPAVQHIVDTRREKLQNSLVGRNRFCCMNNRKSGAFFLSIKMFESEWIWFHGRCSPECVCIDSNCAFDAT